MMKIQAGLVQLARLAGPVFLIALAALWVAPAQEAFLPPAAVRKVIFTRDIKPLIEGRCQVCHGAQLQSNGLRFERSLRKILLRTHRLKERASCQKPILSHWRKGNVYGFLITLKWKVH